MEKDKTLEKFPAWIVLISNLSSILIYLSGSVIVFHIGWIAAVVFLAFIIALEYRLISRHCVNCYYWGKVCGFGKGRLSALFFKKGDPARFCEKEMTWKDLIPDLLVSLIPFIAGIVLIIISFDIVLLVSLIVLVLLTTAGNNYIRGNLTCRYCRQREIDCPAERLFNKEK